MPLALVAAGVTAAGAVASSVISGNAADSAARTAANTAAANDALQSQIYSQNSANEQPYIQSGDTANTALQGFLGLGGNPAATQKAFNDYLGSTGYQFNKNQGIDAVQQSKAASGMLESGSTLKSLDEFGTNLANQYGQQYVGNLQNDVNTGVSAANSLAAQGQNYANAVSSNNNNASNVSANADLAGAANANTLISQALGAYGATRGASSFGGGSSGNAMTGYSTAFNQPGYAPFGGIG